MESLTVETELFEHREVKRCAALGQNAGIRVIAEPGAP